MEVAGCKAPGLGDDRVSKRKSAIKFGLAVSAACAAAGGAMLAYLPGVSMGTAFGLGSGGLLFLMSFSFFYVPMLRPLENMSPATFYCATTTTFVLASLWPIVLIIAVCDKAVATGVMLAAGVTGAAFLAWFVSNTEHAPAQCSRMDDVV